MAKLTRTRVSGENAKPEKPDFEAPPRVDDPLPLRKVISPLPAAHDSQFIPVPLRSARRTPVDSRFDEYSADDRIENSLMLKRLTIQFSWTIDMRVGILTFCLSTLSLTTLTLQSPAAFIVEVHETGLGYDNFEFDGDTQSAGTSIRSTAVGLEGSHSIFGGDGVEDTYVFYYRPNRDEDNFSPASRTSLGSTDGSMGNGNLASGLTGGVSGTYNVYVTSPASSNVGSLSQVTLTHEGPDIEVELDTNNGGTGPNSQINFNRGFVGGMNNAWHLLSTVTLKANTTYSVSMTAITNTFVSQRVHAVMWERASGTNVAGDFNGDSILDVADVNALSRAIREQSDDIIYDVSQNGIVDRQDLEVWVQELRQTWFGDTNLDGEFNDIDFVDVFISGEYLDGVDTNSTWNTGDWNADGDFTDADIVVAFVDGGYLQGTRSAFAVPEPSSSTLLWLWGLAFVTRRNRQRKILNLLNKR